MKKVTLLAVIAAMFCATTVNAQKFGKTPEDSTACLEQFLLISKVPRAIRGKKHKSEKGNTNGFCLS